MSTAIESVSVSVSTDAFTARIPAEVAKCFKSKGRCRLVQVGDSFTLTDFDVSIQWIDRSAHYAIQWGYLPDAWIDLAKANLPVSITIRDEAIADIGHKYPVEFAAHRFTIATDALKWVSLATDDEATRYALMTVCISEFGSLVATDGRRMHYAGKTRAYRGMKEETAGLVPATAIRAALKLANKKQSVVEIQISGDDCSIYVSRRDISERYVVSASVNTGRFPAWGDVFPTCDPTPADFKPMSKSELSAIKAVAKSESREVPTTNIGSAELDARFVFDVGHQSEFRQEKPESCCRFDFESFGLNCTAVVMPLAKR